MVRCKCQSSNQCFKSCACCHAKLSCTKFCLCEGNCHNPWTNLKADNDESGESDEEDIDDGNNEYDDDDEDPTCNEE